MVERCDYYSDDEYEYARYLEIESYKENKEEQERLEYENFILNAPVCGNCKHFKPYGVMGFDGYSERCFNPKSECEEVCFDDCCSWFERKE